MRFPEYDRLDALALGALVSRGELTASEALEAALERADVRNPPLNAVVARYDDEARARAAGPLPPGPLSGVPFLLKDLFTEWRGHPATGSCRPLVGHIAQQDSEVVRRLLGAGLVPFGQTNASELGVLGVTEPALRGPARNPWNTDCSPGGSSGGSGAAVAARIVPAAHGNDEGGSLRIPASACGLVALKPTRGRISVGPSFGEVASGLMSEGVLTRSVRDSAALLDVLAGGAAGEPYTAPGPARPFLDEVARSPERLRIAFTTGSFLARRTDPEARAAVEQAARLLAELGHEVVEDAPVLPRDALVHAYLVTVAAQLSAGIRWIGDVTGRRVRLRELEPETAVLAAAGRAFSAEELVWAQAENHGAGRTLGAFFEKYDVLVIATTARPTTRIGELRSTPVERVAMRAASHTRSRRVFERLVREVGDKSFDATGNTMVFNQAGVPAISLPLHTTAAGLPLGVQFATRLGGEGTLFRLAAQLEAARPWADRIPPTIERERVPAAAAASGGRAGAPRAVV